MSRSAVHSHLNTLSDPTRGRIMLALEEGELTVGEICSILQLPQSTVSRHLRLLADERWVEARQESTSRYYVLRADLDSAARSLWDLVGREVRSGSVARDDQARRQRVLVERRARSRAFFDSSASEWERVREELFGRSAVTEALLNLLDDDWTVGDLGCGTGEVTALLAPHVRGVLAIDASDAMLQSARTRLAEFENVELRRGDLQQLPVLTASLDAAVLSLVLHHSADPLGVLREAGRTLRPGGRLLVVDMQPHDRVELQQRMGHVWLGFAEDQMQGWLGQAGFTRSRIRRLEQAPDAAGPPLFAATARRTDDRSETPPSNGDRSRAPGIVS